MIGLREVSARLSGASTATAPAPTPAPKVAWFKKDWQKAMDTIIEKFNDAETRRAALVAEHDDLVVAAVDGDAEAAKSADKLDALIASVDRDLERLGIARHRTAERLEAERAARAQREERERIGQVRNAATVLREKAEAADNATAALAAALVELNVAGERLHEIVDNQDRFSWLRNKLNSSVVNLVSDKLGSESGYGFRRMAFSPPAERFIAAQIPDEAYIVSVARKLPVAGD